MSQPKISVIIPVYNPGAHFEKCLDSLVSQTLKEMEFIIVLDCPTDGSDKIAEKFAATDKRIKILRNPENQHIGVSRNKGLDVAQGQYIGFYDSDDYSEPQMFERLYQKAESENLDVVRCNFFCCYTQQKSPITERYTYPAISESLSNRRWLYEYVGADKVSCVLWNHLFNHNLLKKHNIKFLDTREICAEDSIFFMEAYHNADRLGTIDDYLYYHVFHTSNTSQTYRYRSVKNRIAFFEHVHSFVRSNGVDEQESLLFLSVNAARSLYSGSRKAFSSFPPDKAFAEVKQIKKSKLMMDCVNYLSLKENRHLRRTLKPTIRLFLMILQVSK